MDDKSFREVLEHLLENPDSRTEGFDRSLRELLLDPAYHLSLVDRIKRDELPPESMDTLMAYARDPRPTGGRAWARKVLSDAWKDEDAVH